MHHINPRFPGGLAKCLTLSYDDAVEQDIRLAALMQQHGIAGTFNINSGLFAPEGKAHAPGKVHRRMTLQQCKDTYLTSPLLEIATHGLKHPIYTELPSQQILYDIVADRRNIEEQFGILCRGHAYPYGKYDQQTVDILRACGIVYARTTRSTEKFDLPQNWLELHPTCHHENPKLPELTKKFLEEAPKRQPWLFYLWGHAYEFEEENNWDVIESFFDQVSGRQDVWYATNIQVYDYLRAYNSLIFSSDCLTVYNPTCTDVWLSADPDGSTWMVPAGQSIAFHF